MTQVTSSSDAPQSFPDHLPVTPEQLDQQLHRMLTSPVFQRAVRSARFLEFVVRRSVLKPGEPLAESEIADAVFDRAEFDPRLDPIVRVEAARLRKRVQEYYADQGKTDDVQIHLPARGYVPEIAVLGAQPAVSEQTVGATPINGTAPVDHGILLAVLPFVNLSNDQELDSFCLGLTEEVIACVTDLSDISVVSRTSASQYEGEPIDVRVVGKELGVSHVLEGTVRKGDQGFRATAKLIDCSNGFTTWSKTLEMNSDGDQVTLQAALGGLIAETLEEKMRKAPASD